MLLGGLQKFTLIDYPGKLACTVFAQGCDFRCPFCHNPELVIIDEKTPQISEEEFFDFLQKRRGKLDGVCINGGEPAIQSDLENFIQKIKDLGFLVKLDTNGARPDTLQKLIDQELIDYIAMDIKAPLGANSQFLIPNSQKNDKSRKLSGQITKYEEAIGGVKIDIEKIKESVFIIMNSPIEYEFRTTAVPGLHAEEDFIEIAKWLKGARVYYLQEYRDIKILDENLKQKTTGKKLDLEKIRESIKDYFVFVGIRN